LNDTTWLRPIAHVWTRSAQPWFVFPQGIAQYATQPEDLLELVSLWRNLRKHPGTTEESTS
jgi:hypothetical protein